MRLEYICFSDLVCLCALRQEAHRACACQQKLERLLKDLEETQNCCEALTRQLDSTKLQSKETVTKQHVSKSETCKNLGLVSPCRRTGSVLWRRTWP